MSRVIPNEFSHIEFNTGDMGEALNYFSDVLGLTLCSIQWADPSRTSVRAFMRLNERATISFLATMRTPHKIRPGVTHSLNPGDATVTGTMQHIAFNVDSLEDLLAMRDRIRSKGVHCMGPMDHGFCQSIYFLGPDDVVLEVSHVTVDSLKPWIDPSVVEFAGLTEEELAQLTTVEQVR